MKFANGLECVAPHSDGDGEMLPAPYVDFSHPLVFALALGYHSAKGD